MFKVIASAGLVAGTALGAAYFMLNDGLSPSKLDSLPRPQAGSASDRNGVVIFQRWDGTDCGRKLIDNTTGRIHGSATVGCVNQPSAHRDQDKPRYDPGGRIDAVRSGFNPNKGAK